VLQRVVIYSLLLSGAALILIPFFWMVSTSLKTEAQLFAWPPKWIPDPVAWENYWDSWEQLNSIAPGLTFWRIVGNTLFITVLAMFAEMFSAAVVAYGFAASVLRADVIFFIMLATMIPDTLTRCRVFSSGAKPGC
jgi:multiple sugar transport system permease protein